MNPLIVMGLLSGVPLVLILLLRANGAVAFLALAAGDMLARYFGTDAIRLVQTFFSSTDPSVYAGLRVALLVLPMLLTIIFLRGAIKGSTFLFNLLPTALTAVVTALLAVPLLTEGTKYAVYGTPLWTTLTQMQGTIVGVAIVVSMLMLWTTAKPHREKKKKKKH